jgi:hypothetical protein
METRWTAGKKIRAGMAPARKSGRAGEDRQTVWLDFGFWIAKLF